VMYNTAIFKTKQTNLISNTLHMITELVYVDKMETVCMDKNHDL